MITEHFWLDGFKRRGELLEAIAEQRRRYPRSRLKFGGTWSGPKTLQDDPMFAPFVQWLESIIPDWGAPQIWGFVMGRGTRCALHSHAAANNRWSAVYYLDIPEGSGEFVSRGTVWRPRESHALVFPAETTHEVTEHTGDRERVSIGVNIAWTPF